MDSVLRAYNLQRGNYFWHNCTIDDDETGGMIIFLGVLAMDNSAIYKVYFRHIHESITEQGVADVYKITVAFQGGRWQRYVGSLVRDGRRDGRGVAFVMQMGRG